VAYLKALSGEDTLREIETRLNADRRTVEDGALDLVGDERAGRVTVLGCYHDNTHERLCVVVIGRQMATVLRIHFILSEDKRGDAVGALWDPLTEFGKRHGCNRIILDTRRPGLLKKLAKRTQLQVSWRI